MVPTTWKRLPPSRKQMILESKDIVKSFVVKGNSEISSLRDTFRFDFSPSLHVAGVQVVSTIEQSFHRKLPNLPYIAFIFHWFHGQKLQIKSKLPRAWKLAFTVLPAKGLPMFMFCNLIWLLLASSTGHAALRNNKLRNNVTLHKSSHAQLTSLANEAQSRCFHRVIFWHILWNSFTIVEIFSFEISSEDKLKGGLWKL